MVLKALTGCLAFLMMSVPLQVQADPSTYTTEFTFTSVNLKTKVITDYKASSKGDVIMPVGALWSCTKSPVESRSNGDYVGSFMCWSGGRYIWIGAVCSPTSTSSDIDSADIGSSQGENIRFTVTCKTTKS